MNMNMNNKNPFSPFFISICFGIVFTPVIMGSIIIGVHQAFGQGTPTTTDPVLTSPTPNLQYLPQKAYIVPLGPNGQMQAIPIQESTSSVDGTNIITGLMGLGGIASAFWAKITGSKDIKTTNAAVLQNKEVNVDLAKYAYSIDPAKAAALTDLPAIKLETLEKDKAEFAEKAVKK